MVIFGRKPSSDSEAVSPRGDNPPPDSGPQAVFAGWSCAAMSRLVTLVAGWRGARCAISLWPAPLVSRAGFGPWCPENAANVSGRI